MASGTSTGSMVRRGIAGVLAIGLGALALYGGGDVPRWKPHDMTRPRPPVVTPGMESTQGQPGTPPTDATVLFDGRDLSQWHVLGNPTTAPWKVEDGVATAAGTSIETNESYGDVQLHLEYAVPPVSSENPPTGQERGNSGVSFMGGRYEVHILDSYFNDTYPDGQNASVYGQNPPLVNASRLPGQWQMMDIVFHAPRFDGEKLAQPATVTVLQNGVLVQDHFPLKGQTNSPGDPVYSVHPTKLPIVLQYHDSPVEFRNIWVRPLDKGSGEPAGAGTAQ